MPTKGATGKGKGRQSLGHLRNPVAFAKALLDEDRALTIGDMDRAFSGSPELAAWRDVWKAKRDSPKTS